MVTLDPDAPIGTTQPVSGIGLFEKREEGWRPIERKTGSDPEMQKLERGLKKAELAGKKLAVGKQYVDTAKTAGSFLIPAIIIGGGIVAFGVLWEWVSIGYNWLYLLGIIFVLIIVFRRLG